MAWNIDLNNQMWKNAKSKNQLIHYLIFFRKKFFFFELFYSVKQDNEHIYNNDDTIIEFSNTNPPFLHSHHFFSRFFLP